MPHLLFKNHCLKDVQRHMHAQLFQGIGSLDLSGDLGMYTSSRMKGLLKMAEERTLSHGKDGNSFRLDPGHTWVKSHHIRVGSWHKWVFRQKRKCLVGAHEVFISPTHLIAQSSKSVTSIWEFSSFHMEIQVSFWFWKIYCGNLRSEFPTWQQVSRDKTGCSFYLKHLFLG